jgi:MlaC protein
VTGSRLDAWGAFGASELTQKGAALPLRIDWRVVPNNGTYKISDVIVDSISMAVALRSDFAAQIPRDGGRIEGLLAMLRRETASADYGSNTPSRSPPLSAGG